MPPQPHPLLTGDVVELGEHGGSRFRIVHVDGPSRMAWIKPLGTYPQECLVSVDRLRWVGRTA